MATWGIAPITFWPWGDRPITPMESAPMQARKTQTNMERDAQTQRRTDRQTETDTVRATIWICEASKSTQRDCQRRINTNTTPAAVQAVSSQSLLINRLLASRKRHCCFNKYHIWL